MSLFTRLNEGTNIRRALEARFALETSSPSSKFKRPRLRLLGIRRVRVLSSGEVDDTRKCVYMLRHMWGASDYTGERLALAQIYDCDPIAFAATGPTRWVLAVDDNRKQSTSSTRSLRLLGGEGDTHGVEFYRGRRPHPFAADLAGHNPSGFRACNGFPPGGAQLMLNASGTGLDFYAGELGSPVFYASHHRYSLRRFGLASIGPDLDRTHTACGWLSVSPVKALGLRAGDGARIGVRASVDVVGSQDGHMRLAYGTLSFEVRESIISPKVESYLFEFHLFSKSNEPQPVLNVTLCDSKLYMLELVELIE